MNMESSLRLVESLVSEVRKELFSDNINIQSFVSPSAYDTAWLAMIPAENLNCQNPMFESCLNWVIANQNERGFWGHFPTIDALPSTLVCMVALKKWNRGLTNINQGLAFMESKTAEEILLKLYESSDQNLPRWFVLVFPAAIELAEAAALGVVFPESLRAPIADIFFKRRQILEMENKALERSESGLCDHLPLLSYLEALPMSSSTSHDFGEEEIIKRLDSDGSIFRSPSATAQAFIATYNVNCLTYLESLVQNFPDGGVPAKYPVDEELINLCMVDHIQILGLAELFHKEMNQILHRIYNVSDESQNNSFGDTLPMKLFKDALTFRLLRMQGYSVNPGSFCWFLNDAKVMAQMQENPEQFVSAMHSVFRATEVSFLGESESDYARDFARIILHTATMFDHFKDHNFVVSNGLRNVMKYEMDIPWTARLDHLNHRKWIEEHNKSPLWVGKASFYRLSCLDNNKLARLAVENYEFRQSIYMQELEEMKRWSKKWGLSEMGFGRDKTMYTYYAFAACSCHPFNSIMRMVMAKAATIVTVADDFYDMEGSVKELGLLTTAIQSWEGEGLTGHSKTIFDALDDFVNEFATTFPPHEGKRIVANLRNIWSETFRSWMVEKTWSLTGYVASMDEYLENASISIAVHTIALPATSSFLNLSPSNGTQKLEYHKITKLLMVIARLLNDTQSYEKEEAQGKMNFVHLHMKQNPNASMEDSVAHVKKNIIKTKMEEFMKHVFMDDTTSIPKSSRQLHLSCLKVFHMFFDSANRFDSETALVDDIKKAVYLPIRSKLVLKPFRLPNEKSKISALSKKNPAAGVTRTFMPSSVAPAGRDQKVLGINVKFNMSFI